MAKIIEVAISKKYEITTTGVVSKFIIDGTEEAVQQIEEVLDFFNIYSVRTIYNTVRGYLNIYNDRTPIMKQLINSEIRYRNLRVIKYSNGYTIEYNKDFFNLWFSKENNNMVTDDFTSLIKAIVLLYNVYVILDGTTIEVNRNIIELPIYNVLYEEDEEDL